MAYDFFIWDASPVLIQVGGFDIRWYGVFFATAFLLGQYLMTRIYTRENKPLCDLPALMNYMIIGTLTGARLAHCLFYDPMYYFSHPLDIFKIWEGGLASHGGAAGILLALWMYSRKKPDQPFIWLVDRIAVAAALGGALIRLGNFFNSEIYGQYTDLPWAVVFARIDSFPRHPSQLYESIVCLAAFFILGAVYRQYRHRPPAGLLSGIFLAVIFTIRFFLEFLKVPQAAYTTGLGLNTGQLISIPFLVAGFILMIRAKMPKG
ncbi:MAG: prolipoprotein diacylglyceryl transferase [Desulfobacter sp.]|nr:MAG: prolipoprotein diacylglyceryl transferase [Desulfobacter sp.]